VLVKPKPSGQRHLVFALTGTLTKKLGTTDEVGRDLWELRYDAHGEFEETVAVVCGSFISSFAHVRCQFRFFQYRLDSPRPSAVLFVCFVKRGEEWYKPCCQFG
jgi:hypothetical protein